MIATGADIIDVDHLVPSMARFASLLASHQVFSGQADPVSVIQNGTPEVIVATVRQGFRDAAGAASSRPAVKSRRTPLWLTCGRSRGALQASARRSDGFTGSGWGPLDLATMPLHMAHQGTWHIKGQSHSGKLGHDGWIPKKVRSVQDNSLGIV